MLMGLRGKGWNNKRQGLGGTQTTAQAHAEPGGGDASADAPKAIWDLLNAAQASSREELAAALRRVPDGRLDLSQQGPLTQEALTRLLSTLSASSGLSDEPLMKCLVLGRIDDFEALFRHLPKLRVPALDVSRIRVRRGEQYVPPSFAQMDLLKEQVLACDRHSPLQTLNVGRQNMLEGQTAEWEAWVWYDDTPKVQVELVFSCLLAGEREDMHRHAFHDLLVSRGLDQRRVDAFLADIGFADMRKLDLADMAADSEGWPGLQRVLASPACPVRTLVLPPPGHPAVARCFGLTRFSCEPVPCYLESLFGQPGKGQSGRVPLEVHLKGWGQSDLNRLPQNKALGIAVSCYVISEPVNTTFDQLLDIVDWHRPTRLEGPLDDVQLARYSAMWWQHLIRSDMNLRVDLRTWREFSNTRLEFTTARHSYCDRQSWLRLRQVLKQEGCRLEVVAFQRTEVSPAHGGRKEFLSAFVGSKRLLKLDLSEWGAEPQERVITGSSGNFQYTGFGPEDIDHLSSLPVPVPPVVIVLSRESLKELRPRLEPLLEKGWVFEDPFGQREWLAHH